jgi:hypothetical protein
MSFSLTIPLLLSAAAAAAAAVGLRVRVWGRARGHLFRCCCCEKCIDVGVQEERRFAPAAAVTTRAGTAAPARAATDIVAGSELRFFGSRSVCLLCYARGRVSLHSESPRLGLLRHPFIFPRKPHKFHTAKRPVGGSKMATSPRRARLARLLVTVLSLSPWEPMHHLQRTELHLNTTSPSSSSSAFHSTTSSSPFLASALHNDTSLTSQNNFVTRDPNTGNPVGDTTNAPTRSVVGFVQDCVGFSPHRIGTLCGARGAYLQGHYLWVAATEADAVTVVDLYRPEVRVAVVPSRTHARTLHTPRPPVRSSSLSPFLATLVGNHLFIFSILVGSPPKSKNARKLAAAVAAIC